MDGWSVNNGRRGWTHAWTHKWMHLVQTQGCVVWVAWFVGCLLVSWVDGWMDGWSVNNGGRGWTHAWMHKWMECK